ncbi:MAG TPA: LysM peptidoglycan-binding domain-containing protein [Streptosporangiaceae bacterium]
MLTGLTALLVTAAMVVLGIGTGTAQATNSAPARGALAGVTVSLGENLWSVAEGTDPGTDPRAIIAEIIGLNGLAGTTIFPGERLWVPRR